MNPEVTNPDKVISAGENFFFGWLNDPTVAKFAVLIVGIILIQFAASLIVKGLIRSRLAESPESIHVLRRLIRGAGYLLCFLLATSIFRDKLGGLSVAFGVAGAGIAFALQEVIASLAGWVALSFGGFYRVGDRVRLGGIKGDVIEVSFLRTTLMELGEWVDGDLYNGRIVRVANSFVFKEPVYNYSGGFPFVWDEIKVPFKYGCDWRLCRQTLTEVAAEVAGACGEEARAAWRKMVLNYRIEDARLEPLVTLTCNDNWIEFTVRYVVDFKGRRAAKDELFQAILQRFETQPDRLCWASATFHLVEAPPLQLHLHNAAAPIPAVRSESPPRRRGWGGCALRPKQENYRERESSPLRKEKSESPKVTRDQVFFPRNGQEVPGLAGLSVAVRVGHLAPLRRLHSAKLTLFHRPYRYAERPVSRSEKLAGLHCRRWPQNRLCGPGTGQER